jgi:hypothetical protein
MGSRVELLVRQPDLRSRQGRPWPGRARNENARWVLFRSHYGFDPFYCQPGIEGAHEKGGVEGAVRMGILPRDDH